LNFDELALYRTWRTASVLRALYYFMLIAAVIYWLISVTQNPEEGAEGGVSGFWQRFLIGLLVLIFSVLSFRVLAEVILVPFINSKRE